MVDRVLDEGGCKCDFAQKVLTNSDNKCQTCTTILDAIFAVCDNDGCDAARDKLKKCSPCQKYPGRKDGSIIDLIMQDGSTGCNKCLFAQNALTDPANNCDTCSAPLNAILSFCGVGNPCTPVINQVKSCPLCSPNSGTPASTDPIDAIMSAAGTNCDKCVFAYNALANDKTKCSTCGANDTRCHKKYA